MKHINTNLTWRVGSSFPPAPVNVARYGLVLLPAVPDPPNPLHTKEPYPRVEDAPRLSVEVPTTRRDGDAAKLISVPSTVTAGAPGVIVTLDITMGEGEVVVGFGVLTLSPAARVVVFGWEAWLPFKVVVDWASVVVAGLALTVDKTFGSAVEEGLCT
jgi:hypothetical protein